MEESRYCEECGTLNGKEYKYCKNCGAALSQIGDEGPTLEQNTDMPDDSIDGVPVADMFCFVGKNGNKIIEKWKNMRRFGRKVSWCWPAFLFAYFFGIAGAGFWFLYRRMYKLGAALLALSFAVSAVSVFINSDSITGLMIDTVDCFEQSVDNDTGMINEAELSLRLDMLENSKNARRLESYSEITEMIGIAAAVLAGLFSLYLYKKFAVSKVGSYSRTLSPMELSLAGGTSGGILTLGMLLYLIAETTVLSVVILGAFV